VAAQILGIPISYKDEEINEVVYKENKENQNGDRLKVVKYEVSTTNKKRSDPVINIIP